MCALPHFFLRARVSNLSSLFARALQEANLLWVCLSQRSEGCVITSWPMTVGDPVTLPAAEGLPSTPVPGDETNGAPSHYLPSSRSSRLI